MDIRVAGNWTIAKRPLTLWFTQLARLSEALFFTWNGSISLDTSILPFELLTFEIGPRYWIHKALS